MAGNKPIALIGGGTTMIGDPSGRNDMRKMPTKADIDHYAECFKRQMERFIDFGEGKAMMLNNDDWLMKLNYIALLRESKRFAAAPEVPALRSLPLYALAVSAGTGQFLDSESYEMQPVGPEVPEEANFGVRVAGDSMEPRFHDGQTVWVHQQPTLAPGEIGVFLYDGNAYLKQLRRDGGRVWLHSLNPAYHDLEISDAFPLRVLGKAVS